MEALPRCTVYTENYTWGLQPYLHQQSFLSLSHSHLLSCWNYGTSYSGYSKSLKIINIVSSSLPEVVPGLQDMQADSLADFHHSKGKCFETNKFLFFSFLIRF